MALYDTILFIESVEGGGGGKVRILKNKVFIITEHLTLNCDYFNIKFNIWRTYKYFQCSTTIYLIINISHIWGRERREIDHLFNYQHQSHMGKGTEGNRPFI